ncbi:MAG: hypothetical protein ACYC4U_11185 [Pirellulaceae bacterium]
MKFDELKLLVAINSLQPKGDPITDGAREMRAMEVRDEYTRIFGDVFFPWNTSDVIEVCVNWRKQTTTRLKAEIAAAHGYECFWKHRDKGPCSSDAEGGHVVSNSSGNALTVANGMIECRAHDNQRRERSIEDYLVHADVTAPELSTEGAMQEV